MCLSQKKPWPTNLTPQQRVTAAELKIDQVHNNMRELIAIHANNEIIIYSDKLRTQIPSSNAAAAYNVFQNSMMGHELVRLCALWETADEHSRCLPTIVELVDCAEVIELLANSAANHFQWSMDAANLPNGEGPSSQVAVEIESENKKIRVEESSRAKGGLLKAIVDSRETINSSILKSVKNYRNKYLAHSLDQTRAEKNQVVAPPKYDDERILLNRSLLIIETFSLWIRGINLSLDENLKYRRKEAGELWNNCTFAIPNFQPTQILPINGRESD